MPQANIRPYEGPVVDLRRGPQTYDRWRDRKSLARGTAQIPEEGANEPGFFDWLNQKRAGARDVLARAITNPGEGPPGDPGATGLHKAWMSGTAEKLAPYIGEGATRFGLSTLGEVNEVLSGYINALGGKGFNGFSGYDRGDVQANSEGIAEGILRAREAEGMGPEHGPLTMMGETPKRRREFEAYRKPYLEEKPFWRR